MNLEYKKELEVELKKVISELITEVEKREEIIVDYKKLQEEHEELMERYDIVSQKYNSLKNSKLGKFTISYWKFKNRVKTKNQ